MANDRTLRIPRIGHSLAASADAHRRLRIVTVQNRRFPPFSPFFVPLFSIFRLLHFFILFLFRALTTNAFLRVLPDASEMCYIGAIENKTVVSKLFVLLERCIREIFWDKTKIPNPGILLALKGIMSKLNL